MFVFPVEGQPMYIDYVGYLYFPICVLFVFPVEGQPVHHRLRREGELTEVTRWILPRALLRLLQEGEGLSASVATVLKSCKFKDFV